MMRRQRQILMQMFVVFVAAVVAGSLTAAALVAVALATGCQPGPLPPRPLPDVPDIVEAPDAADVPPDEPEADGASRTPCSRACAVLKRFACQEAQPTPGGTTCGALCQRTTAYPGLGLPVDCVTSATTLTALRRCNVCKAAP